MRHKYMVYNLLLPIFRLPSPKTAQTLMQTGIQIGEGNGATLPITLPIYPPQLESLCTGRLKPIWGG
jgi:hypothetical protein